MTIYLGADHGGWNLKEAVKKFLLEQGHVVQDLGNDHLDPDDDYPDFSFTVATQVAVDPESYGILFCGNAQGVCITANKVRGIRAGIGYSLYAAQTMRKDDDTNILCLAGRVLSEPEAREIVKTWLETPFDRRERYMRRLKKLQQLEEHILKNA